MLAPIPMIGALAALLLIIDLAAVQLLSSMPHPSHEFRVQDNQVYMQSGDDTYHVLSISNGHETIQLLPLDLLEEPDILSSKQELNEFFDRQSRIYTILSSKHAVANTTDGPVELDRIQALLPGNITFWLQLFVGNIGLLVGVAVWTFQRSNIAARHLCITGLGLAMSSIAAAVYSSRSVVLEAGIFEFLSYTNFTGVLIFSAGFLGMMWNYPGPLTRFLMAPIWYGLLALMFFADYLVWTESIDLTRRLPPVITLILAGIVIAVQWYRSGNDPLTRQSLHWFVFVTLSGSTFFVLAVMVPPLFDQSIIVPQGIAFVAFLTIYIGLAVGVARYPLFDLQQYWIKSMIWLLGGLGVIGLNLMIVSSFGLSNATAVLMILASIAAVFIPLRALGTRYVLNRASRNFQSHLPQIVERMSQSMAEDVESIWSHELKEIFQPLEMNKEQVVVVRPVVVKQGLGLVIPGMVEDASYHLEYADSGTRLFNSLDVTLIDTLNSLFEMNVSRQQVADDARSEERGRLKRDLHDTLGGRLLTIMQTASDESTADESRQAMAELREIITAVDGGDAELSSALENWQTQLSKQAAALDASFDWAVSDELLSVSYQIPGRERFHLGRILRELTTNALRHAGASEVKVEMSVDGGKLLVHFSNNGEIGQAENWQAGNGLNNLRTRSGELGGSINWRTEGGLAMFELSMPLNHWLREAEL